MFPDFQCCSWVYGVMASEKEQTNSSKRKVDAIIKGMREQPIGSNKQYNIPAINTCNEKGVNDKNRGGGNKGGGMMEAERLQGG